jgi:spore coat protein CotH
MSAPRSRLVSVFLAFVVLAACGAEAPPPRGDDDDAAGGSGGARVPRAGSGGRGGSGGAAGGSAAGRGGASSADAGSGRGAEAGAGGAGAGGQGESTPVPNAPVLITEVMYHPVGELGPDERHEFVEIHNRSDAAVPLAGWKLEGAGSFTFPAGATIGPKQYLVLARDRDALLALKKYGLTAADVVGVLPANLKNGGGVLQLVDGAGKLMDQVAYKDGFPWPMVADAFGAGEDWLGKPYVPFSDHKGMGCSLERVSLDLPGDDVANWEPSDIDGATPARPNKRAGEAKAIVLAHSAAPDASAPGKVVVKAKVSAHGKVNDVLVKWWVDVLDKDDEAPALAKMTKAGDEWTATLSPPSAPAVVRYQILLDRGAGPDQAAPRPTDPMPSYGIFLPPPIDTKARVYHLFIDTAKWQQMYTNVAPNGATSPRKVLPDRCTINPKWNDRVPATFAFGNQLYDVQVRYAGSNYNRIRGLNNPMFAGKKPTDPNPFRVLTMKVKFPRWGTFEKKRGFKLNKLNQSCPGVNEYTGGALFRAVGIPASNPTWARVYINGAYYHYMMEVEETHEEFIDRNQPKNTPVGDLFKADGISSGDEGPYTRTDFSPIPNHPTCKYTAAERYAWNYSRETHDWKKGNEVQTLIEGLATARAGGTAKMKEYLAQKFDVDQALTYIAVRNWMGAWDDGYHNYMLYLRGDGRWTILPLDHDIEFGIGAGYTMVPATASFFIGEMNDPNNLRSGVNLLKDAFFKAYREEYKKRLLELSKTVLAPAAVVEIVDKAAGVFSLDDWKASTATLPDQTGCTNPLNNFNGVRRWAQERHDHLLKTIK